MIDKPDIYPGGFAMLLSKLEKRQRYLEGIDDILPAQDIDLVSLFEESVPPPVMPEDLKTRPAALQKWLALQAEFEGQPQILHLHAMLIATSRRVDPPEVCIALFQRIWAEHGRDIAKLLNMRWMISTATTFSDIGTTGDQRAGGMALSILFDSIKLHDSERRISGRPGRSPFLPSNGRKRFPLPLNMTPYSLKRGDLDRIMLARIWQLCERDTVLRPLGFAMLRMLMGDPRSIFARVQELKDIQAAEDDNK